MEKITYNLRYYRAKIVKEILKMVNILSDKKLHECEKIISDFIKIMELHIAYDQQYILDKLTPDIQFSYLGYLQDNINELKEIIKNLDATKIDSQKLEEFIALSAEHFSFCSILDFTLSLLPYNVQDELVDNLKKTHRVLFEK
ncbi:MAG: hypothetical protein ACK4NF_03010 [Planctomycetota bacterium]